MINNLLITSDSIEQTIQVLDHVLAKLGFPARGYSASAAVGPQCLAEKAQHIYKMRRKRDAAIGANLFGEPCWDMLLDLFIQQQRGTAINVTSACLGGAAPVTTSLRWLAILEEAGLVERYRAPNDRRVTLVRLSAKGVEAMAQVIADDAGPLNKSDRVLCGKCAAPCLLHDHVIRAA